MMVDGRRVNLREGSNTCFVVVSEDKRAAANKRVLIEHDTQIEIQRYFIKSGY